MSILSSPSPPNLTVSLALALQIVKPAFGSERAAGPGGLRLRRSDVNRLGAHDRRGAAVDTEQGAGRTAVGLDVGDAQWVVCEGSSQTCIIFLGNFFVGLDRYGETRWLY